MLLKGKKKKKTVSENTTKKSWSGEKKGILAARERTLFLMSSVICFDRLQVCGYAFPQVVHEASILNRLLGWDFAVC